MENPQEDSRAKQLERLFTAVLLMLVAVLLLLSNLYTPQLWGVKVALAAVLAGTSAFFGLKYVQHRRGVP